MRREEERKGRRNGEVGEKIGGWRGEEVGGGRGGGEEMRRESRVGSGRSRDERRR